MFYDLCELEEILRNGYVLEKSVEKNKFTLKYDNDKVVFLNFRNIVKLDSDIFDPEAFCIYPCESNIKKMDVSSFIDTIVCNSFSAYTYDGWKPLLSYENGRAKFDFFVNNEFLIDKYLLINNLDGKPLLSGIVLDFAEQVDFIEAYKMGIVCDDYIFNYYSRSNEDDEFCDDLSEQTLDIKFDELVNATFDKISAGAEVIPRGLFIIKNNKSYYLTAEDYSNIYRSASLSEKESLFSLCDTPGFWQLKYKLFKNERQALCTFNYVINNMSEKDNFELINPSDYLYNLIGLNYKSLSLKRDRRKNS